MSKRVILAVLLILWAVPLFAQSVDTAWVRRYNGISNGWDIAKDIVVDGSGNIYVTGRSAISGSGYDYVTIKYDSNGDTAWIRLYNSPVNSSDYANSIAIGPHGNFCVTGYSYGAGTGADITTVKYDSSGNELWARRYNGIANASEYECCIAIDLWGNIIVSGSSVGEETSLDYATVKYYPNGDTAWVRRYNGPANDDDVVEALALDDFSNIYVTGASRDTSRQYDFATIKYDSSGNMLWKKRYNSPADSGDYASGIALGDNGCVYVAGDSEGESALDYVTIKYDSLGNEIWVRRYDGPANSYDYFSAMAVSATSYVYVTGWSVGIGSHDFATVAYDSSGNELWVGRYSWLGSVHDGANDIVVDSACNVYVTGASNQSSKPPGDYDYATIKYDSSGNMCWAKLYNGLGNCNDEAHAIAVDGSGNVYITGESPQTNVYPYNFDYATVKYVQFLRGDVTNDEIVDVVDMTFLLRYVLRLSTPPIPILEVGDVNCDDNVDIVDIVYMANYLFKSGPAPCI